MSPSSRRILLKHASRYGRPLLPQLRNVEVHAEHADDMRLLSCLVGPALTTLSLVLTAYCLAPHEFSALQNALNVFFERLSKHKPRLSVIKLEMRTFLPPTQALMDLVRNSRVQHFEWSANTTHGVALGRTLFELLVGTPAGTQTSTMKFADGSSSSFNEETPSKIIQRLVTSSAPLLTSLRVARISAAQLARMTRCLTSPGLSILELIVCEDGTDSLDHLLRDLVESSPVLRRITITTPQYHHGDRSTSHQVTFPLCHLIPLRHVECFVMHDRAGLFLPPSNAQLRQVGTSWGQLEAFEWNFNAASLDPYSSVHCATLDALVDLIQCPELRCARIPFNPIWLNDVTEIARLGRFQSRTTISLYLIDLTLAESQVAVNVTAQVLNAVHPPDVRISRWITRYRRQMGAEAGRFWADVLEAADLLSNQ